MINAEYTKNSLPNCHLQTQVTKREREGEGEEGERSVRKMLLATLLSFWCFKEIVAQNLTPFF